MTPATPPLGHRWLRPVCWVIGHRWCRLLYAPYIAPDRCGRCGADRVTP